MEACEAKAKAKDRFRPANHRVVGMMTGVVRVAGIEQIRKKWELVKILHLGAGSSRWGERGSGGWVPTLKETTLSAGIAKASFSRLKSQLRLARCNWFR